MCWRTKNESTGVTQVLKYSPGLSRSSGRSLCRIMGRLPGMAGSPFDWARKGNCAADAAEARAAKISRRLGLIVTL